MRSKNLSVCALIGVALVALLAISTVLYVYFSTFTGEKSISHEVWGQFGDYVGGLLNPLLSFLALVAILSTLYMQVNANHDMEKRHSEQIFDSRFFQLLSFNLEIANSTKIRNEYVDNASLWCEGHMAVSYVGNQFFERYLSNVRGCSSAEFEGVRKEFVAWKRKYWPVVANYYESIIFIIEFISRESSGDDAIRFYLSAVKAQMTPYEQELLFYVMLCSSDSCRFITALQMCGFWSEPLVDDPLFHVREKLIASSFVWSHMQK